MRTYIKLRALGRKQDCRHLRWKGRFSEVDSFASKLNALAISLGADPSTIEDAS